MKPFILTLAITLTLAVAAHAQEPHATLSQQKMCDEQAHKRYVDEKLTTDIGSYSSHYDAKTHICYARISHVWAADNKRYVEIEVSDAFEHKAYASFGLMQETRVGAPDAKPYECYVITRSRVLDCKTREDFATLLDRYFGL